MDPISIAQLVIVCVSGIITLIKYIIDSRSDAAKADVSFPNNLKKP